MTSEELVRRLESRLDARLHPRSRRRLEDGFKGDKVVGEVLDRSAIMTLYRMISEGTVSGVNGAVSAGKESVVFWAESAGGDVALKVYLVSASNFKRRAPYIAGDPRFAAAKRGTRSMVYLWARKEFRNLSQCAEAGIPVPRPIAVRNAVLAMGFVGSGGAPARTLLASEVDADDYGGAVSILRALYQKARLVHGDYSEYNVFKTPGGLVPFDLGSAVDVRHPGARDLLQRDINNVNRFFSKRGVPVRDADEVYREVAG